MSPSKECFAAEGGKMHLSSLNTLNKKIVAFGGNFLF